MSGSPSISSLFQQKIVVGVGEMAVSRNPGFVLSTYALGSCVGIVAYAASARIGGILHLMLPDSSDFPEKSAAQPAMFANTGIPKFFASLFENGARRSDTKLFVAGGAAVLSGPDRFKIGERNILATKSILSVFGCHIVRTEVGGTINRTLHLNMDTGALVMKTPNGDSRHTLA